MSPRRLGLSAMLSALVVVAAAACSGGSSDVGAVVAGSARATTPRAPHVSAPPAASAASRSAPAAASAASRLAPMLVDLVRADGTSFDLADLRGHPALVFFGYTHCPDVCPTTIGELFGVLEGRPEARAVFVSVDPERDSVDFLERWTRYFPSGFIAVTGSPGAIRRAADGFGVRYARVETTSTAGYTMSHTADVFLVDAEGQLRQAYPFGTGADTIIADLARLGAG